MFIIILFNDIKMITSCCIRRVSGAFLGEGVVGAICCSGTFEIWSKLAPEFFQKVKNIWPKMPQGIPKSVQGVPPPPPKGSKNMSQKRKATAEKVQATGSKMGARIEQFGI